VKRLVKVGIVVAVIGALAFAAKKLMGGLGPEPGSDTAPKAWPSLIPEPSADASEPGGATASRAPAAQDPVDAGGEDEPAAAPDASATPSGTNGDAPAASTAET